MKRMLATTLVALLAAAGAARAGGPPMMYAVVNKVVLEPNGEAPERIQIWGSFTRAADRTYQYSKPAEGYLYLSVAEGKAKECRAEWAKWKQAVGTGKAVSVGSCGEAGTFLTAKIRKPDEKPDKPDAAYSPEQLGRFGAVYADPTEEPVAALLAFDKERRQAADKAAAVRPRP